MAVAGMLALSSCSNDDNDIIADNTPHAMTFTASYGDGDAATRATMNFSSDKKVSFDASDAISILSAKNANTQFTTSEGGSSAAFTGTATDDSKFYAVYPYTSGLTLDGTTIKGIVIPTEQWNSVWAECLPTAEKWGWDPKAPIALAVADANSALKFKNLCAIVKVNFEGECECYAITISADQNLAGTFDLDTTTGALTATSGSNSVTTPDNDYDMDTMITSYGVRHVYLAIAPGTYTNFNLKIHHMTWGDFVNKTKSSATFEAGKIYDLGTFAIFN